ncbi:MAG: Ycf48-like protein [Ignavibacteriaceae bacterium]|nr:Ycf48-like protein [Ignavibacteriaceae bacterium]
MKNIVCLSLFSFTTLTVIVNAQWVEQTLPGDIVVTLGIDFSNQNHGITGGWGGDFSQQIFGVAYYTNDGGSSWIESSVPDSMRVMIEAQVISDQIAYAAGAYNLTFTNNLTNYYHSPLNNPRLQRRCENLGMNFSQQENYRGYFVESTDGGLTWHPKGSFEDSVYYLVGLSFIDQQTGFVIGSAQGITSHSILKTTDGGNNWYYVFPFTQYLWIEDLKFVDNLNGIAVGEFTENQGSGVIFITSDGGENWDTLFNPGMSSIFSVVYPNLNTIIIGGINSTFQSAVYKTTDGGNNWQQIRLYTGSEFLEGVDATQNTNYVMIYGTYFASTQIPFIDISSDAGNSWYYSQFPQYENYILLYSKMVDDTRWYITGSNNIDSGFVLFTDNSGGVPVELTSFTADVNERNIILNWTTATENNNHGFEVEKLFGNEWTMFGFVEGNGTTAEPKSYSFKDENLETGNYKYRLKQIDFDGSYEYSEIVEAEVTAPAEFELSQNYPNPFNPNTVISYQLPVTSNVTLKVYDLLGREIVTLVNEEKPAGTYEVEFNSHSGLSGIRDLPSGIYFYQLKTGNYIETKKMLMIK